MIHALIVPLVVMLPAPDEGQDREAMQIARKITTEGAAAFDRKDAAALAASYLEDGQIIITSRREGGLKDEVSRGRDDVRRFYEKLFADAKEIESKNVVESARLLAPDVLLIGGTFEVKADAKTSRYPFVQVRLKQGDRWLMSSVRVFFITREGE